MNLQRKKKRNFSKPQNFLTAIKYSINVYQKCVTSYSWIVILQSYFIPRTNNTSYLKKCYRKVSEIYNIKLHFCKNIFEIVFLNWNRALVTSKHGLLQEAYSIISLILTRVSLKLILMALNEIRGNYHWEGNIR